MQTLTDSDSGVREAQEMQMLQGALDNVNRNIDLNNDNYDKFTSRKYQKSLRAETRLAKRLNSLKSELAIAKQVSKTTEPDEVRYEKAMSRIVKRYEKDILPER